VAPACANDPVPPVPQDIRSLEQQEGGCAACHSTGKAPPLPSGVVATPSGHPPFTLPSPYGTSTPAG